MKNIEPINHVFIRTYDSQLEGHTHDYHQILIPLMGDIRMVISNQTMNVSYGEALVIKKGVHHQFQAREDFRFLVINIENIDFLGSILNEAHFSMDEKTLYCRPVVCATADTCTGSAIFCINRTRRLVGFVGHH